MSTIYDVDTEQGIIDLFNTFEFISASWTGQGPRIPAVTDGRIYLQQNAPYLWDTNTPITGTSSGADSGILPVYDGHAYWMDYVSGKIYVYKSDGDTSTTVDSISLSDANYDGTTPPQLAWYPGSTKFYISMYYWDLIVGHPDESNYEYWEVDMAADTISLIKWFNGSYSSLTASAYKGLGISSDGLYLLGTYDLSLGSVVTHRIKISDGSFTTPTIEGVVSPTGWIMDRRTIGGISNLYYTPDAGSTVYDFGIPDYEYNWGFEIGTIGTSIYIVLPWGTSNYLYECDTSTEVATLLGSVSSANVGDPQDGDFYAKFKIYPMEYFKVKDRDNHLEVLTVYGIIKLLLERRGAM